MAKKSTGHKGKSKSSRNYRKNPAAAAKKRAYDRAYRKREKGSLAPDSSKKRRLNKEGARRWAERKINEGLLVKVVLICPTLKRIIGAGKCTKNRGRNGKNGKSTRRIALTMEPLGQLDSALII